jgi:hypothetical protein
MAKLQLITDAKELNAAISGLKQSTATYSDSIQIVSLSILLHAHKHGNNQISKVNKTIHNVKDSGAGKALGSWFIKFGGYKLNADKSAFDDWKGKDFIAAKFTEATNTPWNKAHIKNDKPLSDLQADELLTALLNRLDKPKEGQKVNDNFQAGTIQRLFNRLGGMGVLTVFSDNLEVKPVTEKEIPSYDAATLEPNH